MTPERVHETTFLRGVIGSTIHGLALDGTDDRDEMGVCLEDIEFVAGLGHFEQYIYRTAKERTGKDDAPSQAGDLDLVVYSLRKFVRLALDGNPTILNLLFVPPSRLVCCDARGSALQAMAPSIVSRRAAGRFLGYLQAQRQRLLGERGQKRIHRPELEAAHGYDTKYAMHMLRLGVQGVELLRTGRIMLPIAEPERTWLMQVRRGEIDLQACLTRCGELERELLDLKETSPLPSKPDYHAVERWVVTLYLEHWKCQDFDRWREGSCA